MPASILHEDDPALSFPHTACLIMASGISRRFGSNKLLAEFRGEPLFRRILAATEGIAFGRRLVLTRTPEVADFCRSSGIEVLLHDLPDRNQAIRLGIGTLCAPSALRPGTGTLCVPSSILFCPADQPLLTRGSIIKLLQASCRLSRRHGPADALLQHEKRTGCHAADPFLPGAHDAETLIFRLSFRGTPGAPVLFPSAYFPELCALPLKSGGKEVLRAHPGRVISVEAAFAEELLDADTPEELRRLSAVKAAES